MADKGIRRLDVDSLFEVRDGKFKEAFDLEIERAVRDVRRRPIEGKREVIFKVSLTPVFQDGEPTHHTKLALEIDSKFPKQGGYATTLHESQDGRHLVFNLHSPTDPDQQDIYQIDGVEPEDASEGTNDQ